MTAICNCLFIMPWINLFIGSSLLIYLSFHEFDEVDSSATVLSARVGSLSKPIFSDVVMYVHGWLMEGC